MIEQIRADFEEWYSQQKLDQIAAWHPPGTLDFQNEKYPQGRYTLLSTKQMCWEVWQAAHSKYSDKPVNQFAAKIQAAQAEIVNAECEVIDTALGKVEIQQAIMPHNSTRNHIEADIVTDDEAAAVGIKYLPEEDDQYWTAEQILEYMVKNLRDEDIPKILEIQRDVDMIVFHSSVGRWIRNTFKLWHKENPHLDGMHPDEMSTEILKGLWRTVVRREIIGM